MTQSNKNSFSGFGREILEGIREKNNERLDEAAFEERIIGIEKAIAALRESKIDDEEIILLLQKHWDLRISEAKEFLQQ